MTQALHRTALSVNLNKVALVRNTRHLGIPSVTRAATLCLQAGARGITVHPRPDERHIRAHDVHDLAALLQAWPDREYNIEGNPFHNLMAVASEVKARGLPLHQLTFVPDSVGQFTSDPAEQTYWYGVVTFSFALASFFGAPILGALSDRFGRRPVLLIGMTGLSISLFTTALATALWMLVAVRLVSGAMQANIAVANAYAADVSSPDNRAKHFGMLGARVGVGFMLGPVLGGLLGAVDIHLPFFVAGALTVLNGLYGYFVLPESLPQHHRSPLSWSKASPFTAFKSLNQLEGMGPLVLILALSGLAQFTLHTTWVLYTQMKFGWGPLENGLSLFTVGLMSVIVQGGLMGRLSASFGARRLAIVGLISSAVCYLAWGLATQGWMMIVIVVANLFGFTTVAALQSLIDPEDTWVPWQLQGEADQDWRERIGNAVPPSAAEAIAHVMGTTLLLAGAGETFMLSNMPVWVRPVAVGLSVSQLEVANV